MANNNPETDALKLVETFPVPSGRWFLPPAVANDVGYSLQIYSPTGQFKGEVPPGGVQQRAREGDQVLRINLGQHPLEIKGTLKTKDGFTRAYSLTLLIKVDTPGVFGVLYRQSTDPVAQLRIGMDDQLRKWAITQNHDDINELLMGQWASTFATLESARLGFLVVSVKQPNVELDPHPAAERAKELAERLRQLDLIVQTRVNNEKREEEAKDAEEARKRKELDAFTDNRIGAQTRITQVMTEEYTRRLQQAMRDGIPLSDLIRADPDFANWAAGQFPATPSQGQLGGPASTLFSLPQAPLDAARSVNAAPTAPEGGPREIPALGITLAPVTLTDEQTYFAEQARLIVDRAYVIQRIDTGISTTQSQLAPNDIIVQVEGQSIQDIATVARTIEVVATAPNARLKLHVFRGLEHFDVEASLPPAR
ncbi:MAG TPA: hypothetical protein VFQ25_13745 [Ktedonobacterales bacterium]|nr:hypothetical protein [Ktedonobacterales bacterium]